MPRYDFVSPGAEGANALEAFLVRQAMEQRQAMLDEQRRREAEINAGQRDAQIRQGDERIDLDRAEAARQAEAQRAAMAGQADQREFSQAATIAEHGVPGVLDEGTAGLLRRRGFGTLVKQGQPTQGAQIGEAEEGVPLYDVTPGIVEFAGGSQWQNRRATEAARAEQAAAAQAAAAERAAADRASREAMAGEANATRQMIAGVSAGNQAATRDLQAQILQQRLDAEKAKAETATTEKAQGDKARTDARAIIASLAASLADDSSLSDISGMVEGRRDSFLLPGNAEAMRKYNELLNKMVLEQRGDLKGQGSVSNYDAQQLERSIGLDRRVGAGDLQAKLREIATRYGGAPQETGAPPTNTRRGRYNPATGRVEF